MCLSQQALWAVHLDFIFDGATAVILPRTQDTSKTSNLVPGSVLPVVGVLRTTFNLSRANDNRLSGRQIL